MTFSINRRRLYEVWRGRIKSLTNEKIWREEHYPFIGVSKSFNQLKEKLKLNCSENIILIGERGVGKTTAARFIHSYGKRAYQNFLELDLHYSYNSVDIKGQLNQLKDGVIFIKDIDKTTYKTQTLILDLILEQKRGGASADLQFLASSTSKFKRLVGKEDFRSDLFYLLFPIEIIPLRERKEDIIELINFYFYSKNGINIDQMIENDAKRALAYFDYPHNVSELIKTVQYITSEVKLHRKSRIDLDSLPKYITTQEDTVELYELHEFRKAAARTELSYIERALKITFGQKGKAAALLNIKADDLRYIIWKYFKDYPETILFF